jgi:hypothetical protein
MKPKEPDLARVSFCLKDNALRLVPIGTRITKIKSNLAVLAILQ